MATILINFRKVHEIFRILPDFPSLGGGASDLSGPTFTLASERMTEFHGEKKIITLYEYLFEHLKAAQEAVIRSADIAEQTD